MAVKWKTAKGEILSFSQMSDEHLKNALNYMKSDRDASFLREEMHKRIRVKYFALEMGCPFCKSSIMNPKEFNQEPEIGIQFPEYRFYCKSCGAIGNKIETPFEYIQKEMKKMIKTLDKA